MVALLEGFTIGCSVLVFIYCLFLAVALWNILVTIRCNENMRPDWKILFAFLVALTLKATSTVLFVYYQSKLLAEIEANEESAKAAKMFKIINITYMCLYVL